MTHQKKNSGKTGDKLDELSHRYTRVKKRVKKLREKVKDVHTLVDTLATHSEMDTLREEHKVLSQEVHILATRNKILESEATTMKQQVDIMEKHMETMRQRMNTMEKYVETMEKTSKPTGVLRVVLERLSVLLALVLDPDGNKGVAPDDTYGYLSDPAVRIPMEYHQDGVLGENAMSEDEP